MKLVPGAKKVGDCWTRIQSFSDVTGGAHCQPLITDINCDYLVKVVSIFSTSFFSFVFNKCFRYDKAAQFLIAESRNNHVKTKVDFFVCFFREKILQQGIIKELQLYITTQFSLKKNDSTCLKFKSMPKYTKYYLGMQVIESYLIQTNMVFPVVMYGCER